MPNGKICYLEIPATSVELSASFYEKVFAWEIRTRGDGERAFNDTTGQVGGTWVLGRTPNSTPGMVTYVMVDDIQATLGKITSAGGRVATPRTSLDHGDALRDVPRSGRQSDGALSGASLTAQAGAPPSGGRPPIDGRPAKP